MSRELQRTYRGRADEREEQPGDDERALIIAALPAGDPGGEADRLSELEALLDTAGAEVVSRFVQHRPEPDPRTYLGRGRLAQLKDLSAAIKPDLVAAEGELSAGQQRALEDALSTRVVDRTAVILDIFALHATSAEGKLQVELAQLQYHYSRQEGLWQHLERLGGGVGTRGPGETQLEVDRRMIRDRIAVLRRRLTAVGHSRDLRRRNRERSGLLRVALAGYTNAGKSLLMNALTGADASARNRLFETLDSRTRTLEHAGHEMLLSDTVGFIRDLPHQLVEAFASTLDEVVDADLILHVADAAEPRARGAARRAAVVETLSEIGAGAVPQILVLNKSDLLDPAERENLRASEPGAVVVSARTGTGLDELRRRLVAVARERLVTFDAMIPWSRGDLLAAIHEDGVEITREDETEGARVRALLPRPVAGRIRADLNGGA